MLDLLNSFNIANAILCDIVDRYDLHEEDERFHAEAYCIAAMNLMTGSQCDCVINPDKGRASFKWIEPSEGDFNDTRLNLLAFVPNDHISGDIEYHDHHGYMCYRF